MYQNVKTSIYAYIDHQTESIIDNNLEDYLKSIGKANFFNNLSYILKEVVGNANKANLKRAYFHLNDLDIKDNRKVAVIGKRVYDALFEIGEESSHTTISTKVFSEMMWRSLSINLPAMLDIITTLIHVVTNRGGTLLLDCFSYPCHG